MEMKPCLLEVTEYMEMDSVVRMARVCKAWKAELASGNHWKKKCQSMWGLNEDEIDAADPLLTFNQYAAKYWKYSTVFGPVRAMWKRFEAWMVRHSPGMLATLNPPASEEDLDTWEKMLGAPLPLSLRCVYKLHNGQAKPADDWNKVPFPTLDGTQEDEWTQQTGKTYHGKCLGMLGGWSLYDSHTSLFLLSIQDAMKSHGILSNHGLIGIGWSSNYAVVGKSFASKRACGDFTYMMLKCPTTREGFQNFHVAGRSLPGYMNMIVTRLEQGVYRARLGEILLHPCGNHLGATTTETNGMVIEASPLLLPSRSVPGELGFTYRLTITCKAGSCQLFLRTWKSRSDPNEGFEEVVKGQGVVGHLPVFTTDQKDGTYRQWAYASATSVEGAWGQMGGSLTFVPGTLQQPAGPHFDATIEPMTLTHDITRALQDSAGFD
ncbi:F-box protein SKIP16 [Diplonema papillatum]|nr:F-box protein SKIP16 [Diplonema papillatum]